ncbi:RNA 2',3'-cyclic phosphodiesterase [Halomonas sp. H5]|uniref:RNA 2',3'-cyclic phosphodiesterase n=1 Tax=Halomonas sp. H5 TaxID=3423910 RepID=UPI003D36D092
MRLFFALRPDPALGERLVALAEQARRRCGGRATPRASLHLTLAFLGEVPESRRDALIRLTEAFSCPPGTWSADRYGQFRRGGILWLGSSRPSPALEALHRDLWQALTELGFSPPRRPFLPHITLLRHASPGKRDSCVLATLPRPRLDWHYTGIELVQSVAEGGRHRYRYLASSRRR